MMTPRESPEPLRTVRSVRSPSAARPLRGTRASSALVGIPVPGCYRLRELPSYAF